MTVRVLKENLRRAIWPFFERAMFKADLGKMSFPARDIFNLKRKMVPAIVRKDRLGSVTYDVKLLIRAQTKPCAGKIECWPRQPFREQDLGVKLTARFDIANVDGYVIQGQNFHWVEPEFKTQCQRLRTRLSALRL